MQLARVIGTVVATVKTPGLEGVKLLVIQPLDRHLAPVGSQLVAAAAPAAAGLISGSLPVTVSTIPTTTVRMGAPGAARTWRAEFPSSRMRTVSPAPAPTESTAMR